MNNCTLQKEIKNLAENLKKRLELDAELKDNLNNFFAVIDEKAKNKEINLSSAEWNMLGSLAHDSTRDTESLNRFTNFLTEKF